MVNHELKIEHEWLWRIRRGLKTHEVRKHDRDYQVGDTLILHCTCSRQPPEICHARVTHVLRTGDGIDATYYGGWSASTQYAWIWKPYTVGLAKYDRLPRACHA